MVEDSGHSAAFVVALVAGLYTLQKDHNDSLTRDQQQARDDYQREWDKTQQRYSNLTSLVPLLTSSEPFGSGYRNFNLHIGGQCRTCSGGLRGHHQAHRQRGPEAGGRSAKGGRGDQDSTWAANASSIPTGSTSTWQTVLNSWRAGSSLRQYLRDAGFTVQGVQRVDVAPTKTQLRYYFSDANTQQATKIIGKLDSHGFGKVDTPNLSPSYLKQGCPPREYTNCGSGPLPLSRPTAREQSDSYAISASG